MLTEWTHTRAKKQHSIKTPGHPLVHEFLLPVFELCINGTKQYVPFCVRSLSLSILCAGFIDDTACRWSSFWLSAVTIPLCESSAVHLSTTGGMWGIFSEGLLWRVLHKHTSMCLLLNICSHFSWASLKNGIAGHRDMHVQCQQVLPMDVPTSTPTSNG